VFSLAREQPMMSGKRQQAETENKKRSRERSVAFEESGSSNRQCLPSKNPLKSLKTLAGGTF
jgi:hypothetical protein